MRSLQWTQENSVYVPEIDAQHRQMFGAAAELRRAVLAGEKPAQLELLLDHLMREFAGHSLRQEQLMQAAQYPAREWHRRQHETARAKLAMIRHNVHRGDREAIFESLESFAGWLRDHTSLTDRMLGSYLRNYRREHGVS
ncbi:MAG TPA: hemerythrin family protein [Bryobacteraceae bacterium]|nr:hemerythrin family protein [Bryobacteraceae bacterium]